MTNRDTIVGNINGCRSCFNINSERLVERIG